MKRWYVVYTKPHAENAATRLLANAGVETLFPKIRRRKYVRTKYEDVIEQLFPGYFFAFFDAEEDLRLVKFTRGVRYIVGKDTPLPVPGEIIGAIRDRLDGDIVRMEPLRLSPGDAVVVEEGPFKDFYGIFQRDIPGRRRVMILLVALHTTLEIEPRSVKKAE